MIWKLISLGCAIGAFLYAGASYAHGNSDLGMWQLTAGFWATTAFINELKS